MPKVRVKTFMLQNILFKILADLLNFQIIKESSGKTYIEATISCHSNT